MRATGERNQADETGFGLRGAWLVSMGNWDWRSDRTFDHISAAVDEDDLTDYLVRREA